MTDAYLATLPGRDRFSARITELFDYERFGVPVKKGGRYFYAHNSGLQNQAVLFVRDRLDGEGARADRSQRLVGGRRDRACRMGAVRRRRQAALRRPGWRQPTGARSRCSTSPPARLLADEVQWVKFSNFAWAKNGAGFFYSRFPEPAAGAAYQAAQPQPCGLFPPARHAAGGRPAGLSRRPIARGSTSVAEMTDDGHWLLDHFLGRHRRSLRADADRPHRRRA